MGIDKLTSYVNPKTTGYTAAVGLGLTALSGMSKNKRFKKMHKSFFGVSALAAALHIGQIEYYKYKYKSKT